MDNLIKQMRTRFSGVDEDHEDNEGETSRVRDRRTPSQKTRSFKGDNRRGQNWHKRQSSRELTHDYDYMESDEFRTAVAAAAFAINGVVESRRTRRRRDKTLSNAKSKHAEDGAVSVSRRERERIHASSSSNKMKIKEDDTIPISDPSLLGKKSPEFQENVPEKADSPALTAKTELKDELPRKTTGSTPPFKKTPTFADEQLEKTITNKTHESDMPNRRRQEPRLEDRKAEVWEKTEMERIEERYQKLNAKILEWDNEKKAKAKKTLMRKKDAPEKKRARALQKYKSELEMINQIVEGARSQAEENRRKEITKVKRKADKIRLTGKIPTKTCPCF